MTLTANGLSNKGAPTSLWWTGNPAFAKGFYLDSGNGNKQIYAEA